MSGTTRSPITTCAAFLVLSLLVVQATAQIFPDPNSPSPVLIHAFDNVNRAMAAPGGSKTVEMPADKSAAFRIGDTARLFVKNVELMPGEGASAFRVYARDENKRIYRFPVIGIEEVAGKTPVYALTVKVRDEIGFWEQPSETGDVEIIVTWRGLSSNSLLFGLGTFGGLKPENPALETKEVQELASPEYVGYRWSGDRIRFLEQATFGPNRSLDHRIRRIGIRTWLAEQFDLPYPSSSNPYPNIPLKPNNIQTGCPEPRGTPEYNLCVRTHYTMYPVQTWFFKEAFYGEPQLRHRVAWALSQLWVTSAPTVRQSSHMFAYHKVLSDNAFGNYRTLMKEMTLNPAMGDYLDMARSTKFSPNENYAREILQLFSIGLFRMNQDGTLELDENDEPIPTYDQETVNNFTKVFTGWTFCNVGCPNSTLGAVNFKDPLVLNQNNHDVTEKTLLQYPNAVNPTIAAGMNGNTEIDLALDNIFYHPNLGPFVGRFLIQHLVTSDPTPAYIGRVAAAFNNNGSGVRGDMKAVIRAILLDPEARGDVKTDPNFGKLREPVQLLTNVYRQFGVTSADGSGQSDGYITPLSTYMSQNPFAAPTVFNYYPPNYVIPGTALLAPEFGLMNTGTSIARTNIGTFLSFAAIEVDNRNPPNYPQGTAIDLDEMTAVAAADPTAERLLDELDYKLMHDTMSASMRASILNAVLAVPVDAPDFRVRTALFLIASSSQYQIQR
ncbi:MAG: DUF1800 domain-containing protein [Acidobacteria bacterium]|nr:MAG: DUF1800 domain-containing protein [Acidobacteriota bacterium]REK02257.1 MAG: DUF1800 domain-containing protein [Acidobacteriota bacterium]REK13940.1 MAG: DUF1800 domain-containing protein [Acidobacteriota bacterium]REK41934.1 MAG: DUF1800 domain-containing protein [Acidobacteriota bacterium]